MTKRKEDYPQTEVEITPDIAELLKGFTEEEIATGVVSSRPAPAGAESEGMEAGLFGDLMESIREAGAILRGEREAARRTRIEDLVGGDSAAALEAASAEEKRESEDE